MLFRITSRAHSNTALFLPCQGPKESWHKRRLNQILPGKDTRRWLTRLCFSATCQGSEEGVTQSKKTNGAGLFETPGIEPLRIASMVHEKNRVNCWAGGLCG
jgi:hypothetical protein